MRDNNKIKIKIDLDYKILIENLELQHGKENIIE